MNAHLRKGALLALEPRTGAQRAAISFQYNPEVLIRQILPRVRGVDGEQPPGTFRPGDPPHEEIRLSFELDAAEGMERGKPPADRLGLLPVLSALELLFDGTATSPERKAIETPLLLFAWGEHLRLPVRIAACSITEEAFDADLIPMRARIDLTLQVLTYGDSPEEHPGRRLFREYLQARQRLAGKYWQAGAEGE